MQDLQRLCAEPNRKPRRRGESEGRRRAMDVARRDTVEAELNRLIEKRSSRKIDADEPLSPKDIAEMTGANYGGTRELLSQMVKDGQLKNLGRGLPGTATGGPGGAAAGSGGCDVVISTGSTKVKVAS